MTDKFENMRDLANLVHTRRRFKGISLLKLAEACSCSSTTISNLENLTTVPNPPIFDRIMVRLGINLVQARRVFAAWKAERVARKFSLSAESEDEI